jgi:tetratricopeptide (TPR) repeat protein
MREVALLSRKRASGAGRSDSQNRTPRYWAFLSYSHRDSTTADWLHDALEKYRVPRALVGREGPNGTIPASFSPIFRDRHELAASGDLGQTIREALAASRCLIVLCSPEAARSRWTNEEIIAFKKAHPGGCVLGAIVEGEPFASELKGHEDEECFPPALRQKYDSRGRPTGKRAEPIAADLRETGDGRQLGLLKIVAGMLGIGLDDLVQREQHRRQRRWRMIATASLAGMLMTSGLAVFAFDKRDEARDQRREAEGLVGFMLGDLRAKLEPIGRLDALDAVGGRALEYFSKQDKTELSDAALAQRSKALTLMGEIANTRGDYDGALLRYQEAMAGTAEMVRRAPEDTQRLFDHAQNVFWVGDIALKRGQLARAEAAMREYKRLADQMVALEPDNQKWRMETKYADSNLGVLLYEQRRYGEAARQLERALMTAETLAASAPQDQQAQKSVPESLAWLSDALYGAGQLDEAIAKRERQLALLLQLHRRYPLDVDYRQRLIPAHRVLGRLLVSRGEMRLGIEHVRTAVQIGNQLIPTEPGNAQWQQFTAGAQLDLAKILLIGGRPDEAAAQARAGCDLIGRLVAKNAANSEWHLQAIECLLIRARLALSDGAHAEAQALAGAALRKAKATRGGDPLDARMAVVKSYKLLGDVQNRAGNRNSARGAWQAGLAAWPSRMTANPSEMAMRAVMLEGTGRKAEAKALADKLASIGFRQAV